MSDDEAIRQLSEGGLLVLAYRTWAPGLPPQHRYLLDGLKYKIGNSACRTAIKNELIKQKRNLAVSSEMSRNMAIYFQVLGVLFSTKDLGLAFLKITNEDAAKKIIAGNLAAKTQQIAPWLTTSLWDASKWSVELGRALGMYVQWKSNAKIGALTVAACQ